jgi:hypothetical protein
MSVVTCWSLVSGSCNARDLQPSVMASADTLAALVPPNPYRLALEAFNHLQNNLLRKKTTRNQGRS